MGEREGVTERWFDGNSTDVSSYHKCGTNFTRLIRSFYFSKSEINEGIPVRHPLGLVVSRRDPTLRDEDHFSIIALCQSNRCEAKVEC